MKKNIILIAMMAVAAVACTKEANEVVGQKTVITVGMSETKAAFGPQDGTSLPILWSEGDKISVNGVTSQSLTTGGSATAEFTFDGTIEAPYSAVYPASAATWSDGTATIVLPSEQTYTAGSFDPAVGVLVGTGNGTSVTMKNAMAYLKITLSGSSADISSLEITSGNGEALCGNFTTDFSTISPAGSNPSTVTVNCSSLAVGSEVIVSLPAQTYANGLTIKANKVDGTSVTKTSTKSATMVAGHVYSTSICVTADELYVVGGLGHYNNGDGVWYADSELRLLPLGDGTYVSDKDIYLCKWDYFRIAKADWSEDYSRVTDASDYWTAHQKSSGDEEPFIPGNYDSSWSEGYYMVMFNKNTMKITYAYVGGTQNQPFYLNGGSFNDGTTDWNLVDEHKLDRVSSGIYKTSTPVQLKQWVYFKFDTADWVEYVRSQVDGVDYWTAEKRNDTNDCNFIPKNYNYDWVDGLYNVTLNLRTMTVTCEYYGEIPGTIDPDKAIYLFGGGFTDSSWDWSFVDALAMMPTSENVYATVNPVALNVGCYFKFDKQDWTEWRRDEAAEDFWTAKTKSDPDSYFYVSEDGNYIVTFNTSTLAVTCTKAE